MSALIVLLLAAAQPEFEYPAQMCEQVAHELNNQYVDGYISRDAAVSIIDRCFEQFGWLSDNSK